MKTSFGMEIKENKNIHKLIIPNVDYDELYKQYRWLLNVETDRSNEEEREGLLSFLEYMLDQMNWGRSFDDTNNT
jgi:CRISPR/Cas system CSM-associated protein Csm2 small subunit